MPDQFPDTAVLSIAALIMLGALVLFILLNVEVKKRKRFEEKADQRHESFSADMHGLSVAAVRLDERVLECELKIKDLQERIDDLQKYEQSSKPYFDAIQEIRNGMEADELAGRCGLTLDEAKLLVKLNQSSHGEGSFSG